MFCFANGGIRSLLCFISARAWQPARRHKRNNIDRLRADVVSLQIFGVGGNDGISCALFKK